MKRLNMTVLVLLIALTLAACRTSEPSPTTAAPTTTAAPATTEATTTTAAPVTTEAATTTIALEADGTVVRISSSDLGDILVSGTGHTLYLFVPDDRGESTCYDSCAVGWLPVEGPVVAGEGVDESLLGVTTRTDGTVQATYNGWPLYFHTTDLLPGDHNGQGEDDVWWVIDASGNALYLIQGD